LRGDIRYATVDVAMDSPDTDLQTLESRWRHVSDVVLAAGWLLVTGAIVFIPLGVVADTDCGSLLGHTSSSVCDDRVHFRMWVLVVWVALAVAVVVVGLAKRRRRGVPSPMR
jgi:hypothetical protein